MTKPLAVRLNYAAIVEKLPTAIFIFEDSRLVYRNRATDRLITWMAEHHRSDLNTVLRDHVIQLAATKTVADIVSLVRIPQGGHLLIDIRRLSGDRRMVSVRAPGLELKTIGHHYGLTGRELEVVTHVVCGRANRTIAELLGVGNDTIKKHLTSVFDKLGVDSRTQLMSLIG